MSNSINFEYLKEQILPYFIEVYGEEFKDIIISRMNQIEPIFYCTINGQKSRMNQIQNEKRMELTIKFLEANNIRLSEEIKTQMFKNSSTYVLEEIPEVKSLLKACFGWNEYIENPSSGIKVIPQEPTNKTYIIKQSVQTLNYLGISVSEENFNEWILTDEAKLVFKQIEKLKEYINILDQEYKEFDQQFEGLKVSIEKCNQISIAIKEKYMFEFLKSIIQYASENDKKLLEDYLSSDQNDWYFLKEKIDIFTIVGTSLDKDDVLESFSEKANEILNNPNTFQYNKKTIIKNRIKYYRFMGLFNDQMSPEEFLMTDTALKNKPKQEFIDDIMSKKEFFRKLADQEILEITSSYHDNCAQINRLNLVSNVEFNSDKLKNRNLYVQPCTRIVNSHPEAVALLFFSTETNSSYIDVSLIHEINHAVELSLLEYKENKEFYKSGFDFLTSDEEENLEREYEAFSEVINQMIAMEITEAMHRDGVYLFGNPNTSKITGGTSYERKRPLIESFWLKFKKEIIKSRMDSNLDSLFSIVGKDNFENLNRIIKEYKNLPFLKMIPDIINQKTTDLTIKRDQLLNDAMDVYGLMVEHAKEIPDYHTNKSL